MANLTTKYVGLTLKSPIVVASAGITETVERIRKCQENGAGAVVMKSYFEEEISRTSPTPRFKIIKHDMDKDKTFSLFSYEQASEWDIERYAQEVTNAKSQLDIKIIPSINCITEEGWVESAKILEAAGADALELNTSCPHGSITFRGKAVEETIFHTVRLVREAVSLPIVAKISPMVTSPMALAKGVEEVGVQGVTIFNRMTGLEIDIDEEAPIMHGGYAGHGGPWAIQYPLRWISEIRPQIKINIAGSGGVSRWQDLVKYILVGANVVQTCSAIIMNGYEIIGELLSGLEEYMDEKGYETLDDFRGKVSTRIIGTHDIDRRHRFKASISYDDHVAPCTSACPAHVPAEAYVRLIAQRKFDEAAEVIRANNPFQSICSYVCYHPCEDECTRGLLDEPVAIRALKRFALERSEKDDNNPPAAQASGRKVAIVGAGPAGLTAAYSLVKMGHEVTVFEAMPKAGGMLRMGIPEYRLPREVLDSEIACIESAGVKIETGSALGKDFTTADLKARGFEAILVAVGAQKSAKLAIPGGGSEGVGSALDFLKKVNLGEDVQVGKRVAVIGGGNSAIDAARCSVRLGAEEVYLVYRRTINEMPASQFEIDEAEAEGVRILYLATPTEVISQNGKVTGLKCVTGYLDVPEGSARRAPVPVEEAEYTLPVDMIITAISQSPDSDVLTGDGLRLTERGLIAADEQTGTTNIDGIFAAGDAIRAAGNSVIQAVADGKRSAIYIDRYLKGESLDPIPEPSAVDKKSVLIRSVEEPELPRVELPTIDLSRRKSSFDAVERTLTEEEAVREASRCLACGCGVGCDKCYQICIYSAVDLVGDRYVINEENCDGCGLCVDICPNQAISMTPTELDEK